MNCRVARKQNRRHWLCSVMPNPTCCLEAGSVPVLPCLFISILTRWLACGSSPPLVQYCPGEGRRQGILSFHPRHRPTTTSTRPVVYQHRAGRRFQLAPSLAGQLRREGESAYLPQTITPKPGPRCPRLLELHPLDATVGRACLFPCSSSQPLALGPACSLCN